MVSFLVVQIDRVSESTSNIPPGGIDVKALGTDGITPHEAAHIST